ncbi:MAG: hypothetical protein CVU91_08805 [Firmicutes bacterium HGW-Firmicutes-16]|nr:MAG: hypothetical protein CVU91_08805 [Firmicutes bacterium HGW-Firmicutes-16]
MTAEEIIRQLEGNSMERLKWLVLRQFGVLPRSKTAGELSDEDFIVCGAHMVIDRRLRSDAPSGEGGTNGSFDEGRFSQLSGGRI